jgi:hypothetical protein
MTAQDRWNSLTPEQQNEVCTYIQEKFDTAKAEAQKPAEAFAPRPAYTGRPRMYPVHPNDHPCA